MRRILPIGLVTAGLLAAASMAHAAAAPSILNTRHNLSSTQTDPSFVSTTGTAEVCVFCHTPHGADTNVAAPLWNRAINTSGNYTPYTSPTLDSAPGQPNGTSLACLSCHDGTIAFDALRNLPGSGGFSNTPATDGTRTSWVFVNAGASKNMPGDELSNIRFLGTNLTNDHPISMRYSLAKSPSAGSADETSGFYTLQTNGPNGRNYVNKTSNTFDGNALPLYTATIGGADKDYVQCTSCHDPHRADTPTFLRKANDGSALCLTCHKKDG